MNTVTTTEEVVTCPKCGGIAISMGQVYSWGKTYPKQLYEGFYCPHGCTEVDPTIKDIFKVSDEEATERLEFVLVEQGGVMKKFITMRGKDEFS